MYQISKAEIYWEKLQSYRRMREGYDPTSKDVWQKEFSEIANKNIKEYEDKLAYELLRLYPELRDYMRELHDMADQQNYAKIIEAQDLKDKFKGYYSNEQEKNKKLTKQVERLKKQVETLKKKTK